MNINCGITDLITIKMIVIGLCGFILGLGLTWIVNDRIFEILNEIKEKLK